MTYCDPSILSPFCNNLECEKCNHPSKADKCTCREPNVSQCNDCFDGEHCFGKTKGCGKPIPTPTEGWEERFNKRWNFNGDFQNSPIMADIKEFVAQEKERSYKEGYKAGVEAAAQ